MNKIEVTDEMEQRFCDYVNTHDGCTYRAALEAALNPPPEPEIYITEQMIRAGQAARDFSYGWGVTDIYRAMRRLEPKVEPFIVRAVPAPGQPWIRGLHSDRRAMQASGGGNCDR